MLKIHQQDVTLLVRYLNVFSHRYQLLAANIYVFSDQKVDKKQQKINVILGKQARVCNICSKFHSCCAKKKKRNNLIRIPE